LWARSSKLKEILRGGEIIPLTEALELLANNRYLITSGFHTILSTEAQLALDYAGAHHAQDLKSIESEYLQQQEYLDQTMNDVFGINNITWQTR
jgi:hypothetical protein